MEPEQILARMQELGIGIRDLERRTGINENYLTKSLGKQRRRITVQEMDLIKGALSIAEAEHEGGLRSVPLLGDVPASTWRPAHQQGGKRISLPESDAPAGAYALTVSGDSMDLIVPNGTKIIIDPNDRDFYPGRRFVVQSEEGETTFKEYQEQPARLVPCSSNPEHVEIIIGRQPIEVLGRVVTYILRDPPRRTA